MDAILVDPVVMMKKQKNKYIRSECKKKKHFCNNKLLLSWTLFYLIR